MLALSCSPCMLSTDMMQHANPRFLCNELHNKGTNVTCTIMSNMSHLCSSCFVASIIIFFRNLNCFSTINNLCLPYLKCIVSVFVTCSEKGYYRVFSVGQLSFDCRSYCGLTCRMQGTATQFFWKYPPPSGSFHHET